MFKRLLAAALVSVVSGCVTSDGVNPSSQATGRSARVQQIQRADTATSPPNVRSSLVILGVAN